MKPRRVTAGPSPEEVRAEELSQLFGAAGWMPSQANFADRAFVVWHGGFWSVAGSPPGHGSVSKSCQTEEQILDFLASFEVPEEVEDVADLPLSVDTPSAAALVNAAEEGPREYPEAVAAPDPRDEELKAALARAEAAEALAADLKEKLDPPSLSPQPDAMMIPPDLAQLMMDREPLPEAITRLTPGIDELLDMAQALSDASMEQAIASFPEDRFEEWTERLWAEKARLRTKRGTDEENLSRENLISRVAGLFMRVGAKR